MNLVYISVLPLHITFLLLSMLTRHWKFVVFYLIYLKHLIEFGMTVSFVNSRVMELMLISFNLLNPLIKFLLLNLLNSAKVDEISQEK